MASQKNQTARFILMPVRGFTSEDMTLVSAVSPVFTAAASLRLNALSAGAGGPRKTAMKVLHSIEENGPKLVEMGSSDIAALRVSDPGVRALPLVKYELMRMPVLTVESKTTSAGAGLATGIQLTFVDAKTKKPVRGISVVAFKDFANRVGAGGSTRANGVVSLALGGTSVKLEVLVAYGPVGYWGLGKKGFTLKSGTVFEIQPVDLAVPDYVATLYGARSPDGGDGVKVGIIDSGVDAAHPDLNVVGGAAFVIAENDVGGPGPAQKKGDHGTHVAGIIASNGSSPPTPPRTVGGKRGIAPKTTLMSYRVFPNSGEGADNYDIIRAIDQGVKDGCDLLNLSLGSSFADEAVHAAMKDAFDKGVLCIVAAGNDYRQPVSYPAAWDVALAVSSLGKKGTYPTSSNEVLDEAAPFAKTDSTVYVSAFSNVGPPIDVTGPGGGIVSTLPGGKYGVMSGTSMACPAVTGVLASILSATPSVRDMPRDRQRSVAIMGLISAAARPLGFIQPLEGVGLIV